MRWMQRWMLWLLPVFLWRSHRGTLLLIPARFHPLVPVASFQLDPSTVAINSVPSPITAIAHQSTRLENPSCQLGLDLTLPWLIYLAPACRLHTLLVCWHCLWLIPPKNTLLQLSIKWLCLLLHRVTSPDYPLVPTIAFSSTLLLYRYLKNLFTSSWKSEPDALSIKFVITAPSLLLSLVVTHIYSCPFVFIHYTLKRWFHVKETRIVTAALNRACHLSSLVNSRDSVQQWMWGAFNDKITKIHWVVLLHQIRCWPTKMR